MSKAEAKLRETLRATPTPLAILRASAKAHSARVALIAMSEPGDLDPVIVTYGELLSDVEDCAAALCAAGVRENDAVALLLPPSREGVVAFLAAMAVGAAFPVNLLFSADAMAAQLALAGARVAMVAGPHPKSDVFERLIAAAPRVPSLQTIVEAPFTEASPGALTWTEFIARGRKARRGFWGRRTIKESSADRDGAFFYTGGTTGEPKLATLSLRNVAAGALMTAHTIQWTRDDRILSGLPLFHVAGAIDALLGPLAIGSSLVFPSQFGARDPRFPPQVWSVVERTKTTILGLVPTSMAGILDTAVGAANISALRGVVTGGSSLAPILAREFEQLAGVPVCQVYGMTETAGIIAAQPFDGRYREVAVGYPVLGMQVRLGGSGVEGSEPQEVFASGPNVFQGYRTAQGIVGKPSDGWVATGDLGERMDDGQIRICGRSKDIIIRSGHNIDPLMIEEAAQSHPDVSLAGAAPMPDAYAGEVPVLFIALRREGGATPEDIAAYLDERIAEPPARPKRVIILPELPLTPFGKIARYKLRQSAAEMRTREALKDFPIVDVTCSDTTAKRIKISWSDTAAPEHRQRACEEIAHLGLSVED